MNTVPVPVHIGTSVNILPVMVLGPLLFSVYNRDAPSVVEPAKSIQFADDIEVQFSHTSTDVISANLSTAVTKPQSVTGYVNVASFSMRQRVIS